MPATGSFEWSNNPIRSISSWHKGWSRSPKSGAPSVGLRLNAERVCWLRPLSGVDERFGTSESNQALHCLDLLRRLLGAAAPDHHSPYLGWLPFAHACAIFRTGCFWQRHRFDSPNLSIGEGAHLTWRELKVDEKAQGDRTIANLKA